MSDHNQYWLDSNNQPQCADCFPPPGGAVVLHVGPSVKDEIYEQEERKGIQEG